VIAVDDLLAMGGAEGAAALALEGRADLAVDLDHRSLRGVAPDDVPAALVFGCSAEVLGPA
jgi:hypothetical protein